MPATNDGVTAVKDGGSGSGAGVHRGPPPPPRHVRHQAGRAGCWPQVAGAVGAVNVWDSDDGGEWLEISDCAARMGCTPERVLDLVRRHAVRTRHEYGVTLVQPAIVSGAVDPPSCPVPWSRGCRRTPPRQSLRVGNGCSADTHRHVPAPHPPEHRAARPNPAWPTTVPTKPSPPGPRSTAQATYTSPPTNEPQRRPQRHPEHATTAPPTGVWGPKFTTSNSPDLPGSGFHPLRQSERTNRRCGMAPAGYWRGLDRL